MREGAGKAKQAFEDHVVDPARRVGEAVKASGEKVAEQNKAVGLKMIDQAEANAREAFAAMRAAAVAKDLSDVMKIQGDFLREQSNRSMAHAREVGELIMQFGRDAVGTMKGSAGKG
nr:phasin family protein [Sphingomonas sp. 3P27F8]